MPLWGWRADLPGRRNPNGRDHLLHGDSGGRSSTPSSCRRTASDRARTRAPLHISGPATPGSAGGRFAATTTLRKTRRSDHGGPKTPGTRSCGAGPPAYQRIHHVLELQGDGPQVLDLPLAERAAVLLRMRTGGCDPPYLPSLPGGVEGSGALPPGSRPLGETLAAVDPPFKIRFFFVPVYDCLLSRK